jgi:hypothetical protein
LQRNPADKVKFVGQKLLTGRTPEAVFGEDFRRASKELRKWYR